MASTIDNATWAGDLGFVRINLDDAGNAVDIVYQNFATRPATIFVYDKQGRLIEETTGSGYTRILAPGSTGSVPAGRNWDLAPDGSINGWRIAVQGPAS